MSGSACIDRAPPAILVCIMHGLVFEQLFFLLSYRLRTVTLRAALRAWILERRNKHAVRIDNCYWPIGFPGFDIVVSLRYRPQ